MCSTDTLRVSRTDCRGWRTCSLAYVRLHAWLPKLRPNLTPSAPPCSTVHQLAPGSDFSAELGARIDKESFDLATHRQFEPVGSSASHSHAASSSSAGRRASSLNEITSLGSKHSPACTTTDVMRPWLDDEGDSDEEQEEVLLMKSMQRVRLEDEKGIDAGFVGKVRLSFKAQLVGRVALTSCYICPQSSSFNLLLSARDYKYTAAGIKDKFDDDFMKTRRREWVCIHSDIRSVTLKQRIFSIS
jgi:hypothetical protein